MYSKLTTGMEERAEFTLNSVDTEMPYVPKT